MTDFVQERCGDSRGVMGAVDADEGAFFEAGVFAEIEAHDGKAAWPGHAGDLKVGAEIVGPSRELLGRAEPNRVLVEMWPRLALPLADYVAYFGAAKACANGVLVVDAPEARNFIRSGARRSHTDA